MTEDDRDRPAPSSGSGPQPSAPGSDAAAGLESTTRLLHRIREGDARARDMLAARYLTSLRRFAHGRLPAGARDLVDTDDLVQVTLVRALNHVEEFEPRGPGSFLAYLRRGILNQVRDQARRVGRAPGRSELSEGLVAPGRSPLEEAIGRDALERYERALARLPREQQEAVVLRIELGFTYEEIAAAIGSPTANASRMLVTRALARLADIMREPGVEG